MFRALGLDIRVSGLGFTAQGLGLSFWPAQAGSLVTQTLGIGNGLEG